MSFFMRFMKNAPFSCSLVVFAFIIFSINSAVASESLDREELIQLSESGMRAEGAEESPATMSNGSVVEFFIRDAASKEDCLIDFDTGRILSYPPDEELYRDRKLREQWLRDNGVDAIASVQDKVLYGRDILAMPMDSKLWDNDSAEDLTNSRAWKWFREGKLLSGGGGSNVYARAFLPAAYMFETGENSVGLLQIIDFENSEPQGVTIRYKMLGRSDLKKDRQKIRQKLHPSHQYTQAFVQACLDYSINHNNILPQNIAELKEEYSEQADWAERNVVYVAGGMDISKPERPGEIPLCYSSMDFGTSIISRIDFLNGKITFTANLSKYVLNGSPVVKTEECVSYQAENSTITLPSGLTVELLGLSRLPAKSGPFWRKDGTLRESPIFDNVRPILTTSGRKSDPDSELFGYYAVAARLSGEALDNIDGVTQWDLSRSIRADSSSGYLNGRSLYDQNMRAASAIFLKDTTQTTVRCGIAAGVWKTVASGKHHGVYENKQIIIIVGAPREQGGPLGIFSMGPGIYIGLNYYVGEMEFRAIAVDRNNQIHFSQQSGGRAKTMQLWYTNAVFPGLNYDDLKEFQFQVRPYEWAEFKNVSLRPDVNNDI